MLVGEKWELEHQSSDKLQAMHDKKLYHLRTVDVLVYKNAIDWLRESCDLNFRL
jgi:hypothetical protein